MSLARRTIKNSLYSLLAFGWPLAISFLTTPFIVQHLGVERYGILALVASFIGFLAFVDFGISPSLVKYTVAYKTKGDYPGIGKLFSSALLFYILIGISSGILIAILGQTLAGRIIKVSPENVDVLKIAFVIAGAGFFINMVLSAFSAIPGALQRFDLTSRLNIAITTISTVLTIVLLLLGKSIISLLLLGLLTSSIAIVIYSIINRHLLPQVKFFNMKIDRKLTKQLFTFGGYAAITSIAGTVLFELDKLVLGSLLGVSAVAFYVLPGNLALKIHSFVAAMMNIIFPLTSELYSSGDFVKLHELYTRATRIVTTLLVIGVTPMIVFAHTFLLKWVGSEFAINSTVVLQVLLITYSIIALTVIPFFVVYGAGKPSYNAFFSVASGVLNVVLLFILIPRFGINGAAYAYLLSVLPAFGFVWVVEKRILKIDTRNFYASLLPRLIFLGVISIVLSLAFLQIITSLLLFLVFYTITVVISGLIYIGFGFAHRQDLALLPFFGKRYQI